MPWTSFPRMPGLPPPGVSRTRRGIFGGRWRSCEAGHVQHPVHPHVAGLGRSFGAALRLLGEILSVIGCSFLLCGGTMNRVNIFQFYKYGHAIRQLSTIPNDSNVIDEIG